MSVINIGKSYEDNDMLMVKISTGGTGKKAILADGGMFRQSHAKIIYLVSQDRLFKGIHAREWIAPAFATWLISELVENYTAHPQYVDNVDWYILNNISPFY